MSNKYSLVMVLLVMLSLLTSCLGNSDSSVTYYDDAAITSFSLGTLKRTIHTKTKKGEDSTYVVSVAGSKYRFSIDQQKGLIYNIDSLPQGTDASKVLVTINTRNSGIAFLKSLISDSVTVINATDSLDFSQERTVTVLSNDGAWTKDYLVNIRVHKEEADKLYWIEKKTNPIIGSLSNMKAIHFGGNVYVYGTYNGKTTMYCTPTSNGNQWTEVTVPFVDMTNIVKSGNSMYAISNGKIYTTTNGKDWNIAANASNLETLIAGSSNELYALTTEGRIAKSNDGAASWQLDELDYDAAYLPKKDINSICKQSLINPDIEKLLIIGNRGVEGDKTASIWSKNLDNSQPSKSQSWMFQPFDETTWHHAPVLNSLSVTDYGKGMLMLGSYDASGMMSPNNFGFYYSWDEGLNWWEDKRFTLPEAFRCDPSSTAIVSDGNNRFWILCGITGQVWVGYFSTWTWE